jgi:hypothetical protein
MAKTTNPKDEIREGYKLAVTMLRELEASTDLCDLCALDEFVAGRASPQDNVVLRYLHECRARSVSVEAGFCAILSDFVADCSEGMVPKAETYQKGLKIRAPGRGISAADNNRRTWKLMQRITGSRDPIPAGFGTPEWAKKQSDAHKSAAAKGRANHG